MASSPRTGRSSYALTAIVIGAVLLIGVAAVVLLSAGDPLGYGGRIVESLYPPAAVTAQGAKIRELYTIIFLIAVVIFFVVEGLIVWTVLRYRRKPGDDVLPAQTHGNNVAEIVWTVVPTIIVAFMFVISWQTLNEVDAVSATPETRIRAVAGQFQWKFDYLDETGDKVLYTQLLPNGAGGGMYVPAGRQIRLTLESPDVIHAFYVPQFLFKRDVVPGRINAFDFNVDADMAGPLPEGQAFNGQCAELCGTGHSLMLFQVKALSPTDFDGWLADQVAKANATPAPPPSVAPGASGEPAPSGAPAAGPPLQVSAVNIQYEQSELTAPANTPFQIAFDNKDADVPHNVAIHQGTPTGQEVFMGEIITGVAQKTYDVPPLPAGAYSFVCTVHPTMTGTLTVN